MSSNTTLLDFESAETDETDETTASTAPETTSTKPTQQTGGQTTAETPDEVIASLLSDSDILEMVENAIEAGHTDTNGGVVGADLVEPAHERTGHEYTKTTLSQRLDQMHERGLLRKVVGFSRHNSQSNRSWGPPRDSYLLPEDDDDADSDPLVGTREWRNKNG